MRRTCAIQQAIYLLKVMFRWIQLLAITGERRNEDFMLNLLEIMPYFLSFLPRLSVSIGGKLNKTGD